MPKRAFQSVNEYLAAQPEERRNALERVRRHQQSAAAGGGDDVPVGLIGRIAKFRAAQMQRRQ
jgi:hypothetical protein